MGNIKLKVIDSMAEKDKDLSHITIDDLEWRTFESEEDLATIMRMMMRDLSEPYPIYTYRYFVHQWPELTLIAHYKGRVIGTVVSKIDNIKKKRSVMNDDGETGPITRKQGYIAMLSVEPEFRRLGLGRLLVKKSIDLMIE